MLVSGRPLEEGDLEGVQLLYGTVPFAVRTAPVCGSWECVVEAAASSSAPASAAAVHPVSAAEPWLLFQVCPPPILCDVSVLLWQLALWCYSV